MKRAFLVILTLTLTSSWSWKNLNCRFNSYLTIDRFLINFKERIFKNDTIIKYRHRIHGNSDNGYGKIVRKSNNTITVKRLELDSANQLLEHNWEVNNQMDEIFHWISIAQDSIENPLKKPPLISSHDGGHTIEIYYGDSLLYCDHIPDLILQNPENQYAPN